MHLGHINILRLSKRPFSTIEEMNATLIERWNATIRPNDTVYNLGDVAFRHKRGDFATIFPQLNGIKHLLIGNHDNEEVISQPWASVSLYKEIRLENKKIVLCHYPMRSWNKMYSGSLHLYGHEHGNIQDYSNCLDVGVDKWDFYPVSFEQILARMATLTPWKAREDSSDKEISDTD